MLSLETTDIITLSGLISSALSTSFHVNVPVNDIVGTLARVTEEFEGSFVSNNLGVIRINKGSNICAEYLHVLLTSPKIGKLLFEQKEMRTAQPKISDKDIWDFIVPTIPNDCQLEIKELIEKSFALRNESNRLLELAKTAVEIAIEQGEDKAMELLTNK